MKFYPVFKKELHSYFSSIIVYVVISMFLLISGYFFYTDLVYFVMMGMKDIRLWMWQYLFNDIRLVMFFIIPVLTMKLFAEEKKLSGLTRKIEEQTNLIHKEFVTMKKLIAKGGTLQERMNSSAINEYIKNELKVDSLL